MEESILTSIKKLLGITEEQTDFDQDIIMHINTAFFVLRQLGVGPESGFSIRDSSANWDDYHVNINDLEMIKSYVYLKVRILFDPPINSSVLNSVNSQINEFEWRLNVAVDPKIQNGGSG